MADKENDDNNTLIALVVATIVVYALVTVSSSVSIEIPLLNLSVSLLSVAISVVIPPAVVALYLYIKSDILLQQVYFRYKHPRTSITGIIYLIPGITKPHSEYLEKLKK